MDGPFDLGILIALGAWIAGVALAVRYQRDKGTWTPSVFWMAGITTLVIVGALLLQVLLSHGTT